MREKIDCFLPCDDLEAAQHTVKQLRGNKTIQHIFLLVTELLSAEDSKRFKDCQQILVDNLSSSNTMMSIAENAKAEYKEGDVVTFRLNGVDIDKDGQDDLVTHRIYKVNKDGTYLTKGDANLSYDQDPKGSSVWPNVASSNIVAVYHGTKIGGLGSFIGYLQTGTGFFLVILLPMIIFFLYQAVRVVMNVIAYNKEKAMAKAQAMINSSDLTEEQKQKAIAEYLAAQKAAEEAPTEEKAEQPTE